MNKKLWEQFKNGEKIAINCKTENEATKFLKICFKEGIKWIDGAIVNYAKTNWGNYKEATCFCNEKKCFQYGSKECFEKDKFQIITYDELIEGKKIFTGPELTQLLFDKKISEGTKFKNENGFVSIVKELDGKLGLCDTDYSSWDTSFSLINCTFTLIEEPKLIFLNQAAKEGKKIKLKDWRDYQPIEKIINYLNQQNKETIKKALTNQIWEVEQ